MNIHTVFMSKPQWEGGWPYVGFDNEQAKAAVLERLNRGFPEVEFSGGEIVTKYEATEIEKVKREMAGADGLFVYTMGHYGDPGIIQAGEEFLGIGKPSILANYVYGGDHTFIKTFERIKGKALRALPVSSPNFDDVEWAIGIMHGLSRLEGKKILVHAPDEMTVGPQGLMEFVAPDLAVMPEDQRRYVMAVLEQMTSEAEGPYLDLEGVDQAHQWRRDEERYRRNMKEIFGLELLRRDPKELSEYYREADEKEAEEIADGWIKGAKGTESLRQTVVNAAKLYLGMKKLIEETGSDSLTTDCGTLLLGGYMPAFPCLGFHQMLNDGFTATCESDLDSNISALLGRYLFGKPGFVSNHTLDLTNNRVTYLHCMAPSRLHGPDGPPVEYDIVRHGEAHFAGATPRVKFPPGEDLTTIKISLLEKKLALRHGKIIAQVVDEKGCNTKVLVQSDAGKILENYDWMTFGWHRVSFVGDWRREFIAAARLAGLELVEEDR